MTPLTRVRRSPVPTGWTTTCPLFQLKVLGPEANSRTLPLGMNSGRRWLISPFSNLVKGCDTPPASDTCWRVDTCSGENAIIPKLPQLAPKDCAASLRDTAAPPLIEIFFSFWPAKKPSHWLSAEKKGLTPPSVPATGPASRLSIGRR